MLFVHERRRSRRTPKRDRSERSEQSNPRSRTGVLRRSERTCSSSTSDDEVGERDGSERSEQSKSRTAC